MSHDLTRLILQQRLDATAGTDRLAHQAESDGAGKDQVRGAVTHRGAVRVPVLVVRKTLLGRMASIPDKNRRESRGRFP